MAITKTFPLAALSDVDDDLAPTTGKVLTWTGLEWGAGDAPGGSTDPEVVRDTMAAALVAGSNVTITADDVAETITIAAANTTDPEVVRDTIATALVAGAGITITPNDPADTITVASTITQYTNANAVAAVAAADPYVLNSSDTMSGNLSVAGVITSSALVNKTGAYLATANDTVITCDATSAAFTITLPAVAALPVGKTYTIKKTDSSTNAVTIDANASELIDGALTRLLATQNSAITIVTTGSAWIATGASALVTLAVPVPFTASSGDSWMFIADRAYQVFSAKEIHQTAGTDLNPVTLGVRKVLSAAVADPGAAAGANVKELLTVDFDLKATANTLVTGSLSATTADLQLATGDKIGLNFTGTKTGLAGGNLTLELRPL